MKEESDKTLLWYLIRWIMGFAEIIDGLCSVLTFGFWSPGLSYKLAWYGLTKQKVWHEGKPYTKKEFEKIKEKK